MAPTKEGAPTPKAKAKVGLGKVFKLSSQEWPVLIVALFLRIASEGCNLLLPIVLAHAWDLLVVGIGGDDPATTRSAIDGVSP